MTEFSLDGFRLRRIACNFLPPRIVACRRKLSKHRQPKTFGVPLTQPDSLHARIHGVNPANSKLSLLYTSIPRTFAKQMIARIRCSMRTTQREARGGGAGRLGHRSGGLRIAEITTAAKKGKQDRQTTERADWVRVKVHFLAPTANRPTLPNRS